MHLDAPSVRTTGGTFGGRQWPAQALTTVPTTKMWFVSGSLNVYDVLGSDKDYSACASTYYPDIQDIVYGQRRFKHVKSPHSHRPLDTQ
jgi:hypothetical protein